MNLAIITLQCMVEGVFVLAWTSMKVQLRWSEHFEKYCLEMLAAIVHRLFMSASLSELVFGVMQHLAVSFLERKVAKKRSHIFQQKKSPVVSVFFLSLSRCCGFPHPNATKAE